MDLTQIHFVVLLLLLLLKFWPSLKLQWLEIEMKFDCLG